MPSRETGWDSPPPPTTAEPARASGEAATTAPAAAAGRQVAPRPAATRAPARPTVALIPARMATNPYPELLARAVSGAGATLVETERLGWGWLWRERGRIQALHLHWLHVHYRDERRPWASPVHALFFAAMLGWARLLGYRLVWTMHNAAPHDSPTPLADRIARLAAMNLAEVVVHCEAARALLRGGKLLGGVHCIPHGSYIGVYPDTRSRAEARAELGLGDAQTVFLAFGLIRAYKGIAQLVEDFEEIAAAAPATAAPPVLLVVGKPRTAADRATIEALRAVPRRADIRWVLEFVPDAEVELYMRAADFAVTAFERVLVSGSAILALSFGLPVIGPRRGCLPELLAGGAGILYEPAAGVGEGLRAALATDATAARAAAARRAAELDWRDIGAAHVAVYAGRRP